MINYTSVITNFFPEKQPTMVNLPKSPDLKSSWQIPSILHLCLQLNNLSNALTAIPAVSKPIIHIEDNPLVSMSTKTHLINWKYWQQILIQGSKIMMSSHTGQVDFPARQATLISIFKIAQEESAQASCLPTTKTY